MNTIQIECGDWDVLFLLELSNAPTMRSYDCNVWHRIFRAKHGNQYAVFVKAAVVPFVNTWQHYDSFLHMHLNNLNLIAYTKKMGSGSCFEPFALETIQSVNYRYLNRSE